MLVCYLYAIAAFERCHAAMPDDKAPMLRHFIEGNTTIRRLSRYHRLRLSHYAFR